MHILRNYNAYFAITYFTNFALMTNPNPNLSDRGIPEIREMGSMTVLSNTDRLSPHPG